MEEGGQPAGNADKALSSPNQRPASLGFWLREGYMQSVVQSLCWIFGSYNFDEDNEINSFSELLLT